MDRHGPLLQVSAPHAGAPEVLEGMRRVHVDASYACESEYHCAVCLLMRVRACECARTHHTRERSRCFCASACGTRLALVAARAAGCWPTNRVDAYSRWPRAGSSPAPCARRPMMQPRPPAGPAAAETSRATPATLSKLVSAVAGSSPTFAATLMGRNTPS